MRKFCALIFFWAILVNSSMSFAATANNNSTQDPYHNYNWLFDEDEDGIETYSGHDQSFNYQLRSVSETARDENAAGNQWFATVYENYFWYYFNGGGSSSGGRNNNTRSVYRRTLGGEMPTVNFETAADLLNDFNYVLVSEPQPYAEWLTDATSSTLYDTYPDPFESLCLVITNGRGSFSMSFANAYARHFPFWWGVSSGTWSNYTYGLHSPVSYTIPLTGNYANKRIYDGYLTTAPTASTAYAYSVSGDNEILQSGTVVYTISGDTTSHEIYNSSGTLVYKRSDDIIYDANDNKKYTLENSNNGSFLYVVPVRSISERIQLTDVDELYTIRSTFSSNQNEVLPNEALSANFTIIGDSTNYGSVLGYINFSQHANLADGYSNYGESSLIPVVIANVVDGNASDYPLDFDMIIYDTNNLIDQNGNRNTRNNNTAVSTALTDESQIIDRVKFNWAVEANETKDLGTFFIVRNAGEDTTLMPEYYIETRITNNTGTRYRLQRYDMLNQGDITPDHWEYNIVRDSRGTLPDKFYLDPHSQIAPGLITVYNNTANTLSTGTDTQNSFSLYEYSSTSPKNLTLKYKIIAGMTAAGNMVNLYTSNDVGVRGFSMTFVNTAQNTDNTQYQLRSIMGKNGSMIAAADSAVTPAVSYLGSERQNAFQISKAVPTGLVEYSTSSANIAAESGDTESGDVSEPVAITIALQPVQFRLKLQRANSLISSHWSELASSESSEEVLNKFRNYATVWVRSAAAPELDVDLLSSASRSFASIDKSLPECVKAFVYDDELVLEFMAVLADAGITDSNGYTNPFIRAFKDDGVPYILIGDGAADDIWNLEFFIGSTSLAQDVTDIGDNTTTNTQSSSVAPVSGASSGGGGGGCNLGLSLITFTTAFIFGISKRNN